MKAKLQQLQKDLATGFVGRDEIIKSTLLGVMAGENTLLIGPPGTGKSMLARRVSEAIRPDDNADYFEYLLTKFSTPEEIFGPLSISELKEDRFCRNIDGYLPSVKIGFLDEIFKASSSILNALLTILNERKYHNGTHSVDVPLQSLISASNELPIGQEELSALYDRFLIRRFVGYVSSEQLSALFDLPKASEISYSERLTVVELADIRERAKAVVFPSDVQQAIKNIWANCQSEFKENKDEQLSDRRFVKVLNLMRVSAVTNERNAVDFSDILLLKDCLWNNPENQEKILQIIKTELQKHDKLIDDVNATPQNAVKIDNTPKPTATKTPSQNVIRGYQGGGTADDPILIENINHLQGMQRAEVGQQGYYFKQMNDIDCDGIDVNSWFKIELKGHYDGNNKKIVYHSEEKALFNYIEGSVKNLSVENLALADTVKNCDISHCQTTTDFVLADITDSNITHCKSDEVFVKNDIINSTISYCSAGTIFAQNNIENTTVSYSSSKENFANIIKNSNIVACQTSRHLAKGVFDTTIKYCQAKSILIMGDVKNSHIECCQVNLQNDALGSGFTIYTGGIAQRLTNCHIQYCYVDGKFNINKGSIFGSGIAQQLVSSKVEFCAIGELKTKDKDIGSIFGANFNHRIGANFNHRIVGDAHKSELFYNISISLNDFGDDKQANGLDGESISPALFNQYYFEHTLGWDFDNIWQWNTDENRPELRQIKNIDLAQTTNTADENNISNNQTSLLKSQMQNNIWL